MGEGRRRFERFREQHPLCCFCGDVTETRDHVPPRGAFIGRVGPEDFEFPACEACNSAARHIDQLFAFYARGLDRENTDAKTGNKLVGGLANNHPGWLPNPFLSATEKRKAIRDLGLTVQKGAWLSEVPIIGVPRDAVKNLQLFGERLLAAIFYKHAFNITTAPHGVISIVRDFASMNKTELIELLRILPNVEIGNRRNVDLGSQFFYRWGRSEEDQSFAFIACFGNGLTCTAACAPICNIDKALDWPLYKPHREHIKDHTY